MSTLVHLHGGPPVGSFHELAHTNLPVHDRLPRACLYDVTHDNEMPSQKVWWGSTPSFLPSST